MNTLPFLSAAFLLINPILLGIFGRFRLQLEKLQFWIMVSSGTAWIISAIFLLLHPESQLGQAWQEGAELLPGLVFVMDRPSASLALVVCGAVFFAALTEQDSPRDNALLTGLGGAALIGVYAGSAYTAALAWTVLEAANFWTASLRRGKIAVANRDLLLMLVRLCVPFTLVLLTLIGAGIAAIPDWDPTAAPALIAAGLIGFLAWLPGSDQPGEGRQLILGRWIPASLGLVLMVRGAALAVALPQQTISSLVLAGIMVMAAVIGLLLGLSARWWFFGGGILVAGGALLADPASVLGWSAVFLLPGSLIWQELDRPGFSWPGLALAGLGLLPLPFLPAWAGIPLFQNGIAGGLLAAGWGILSGSLLIAVLKNIRNRGRNGELLSVLDILGAAILLLTQLMIALTLGLIPASRGLLTRPALIWLPLAMMALVLMLGNWVPLRKGKKVEFLLEKAEPRLGSVLKTILGMIERLIVFVTRLLEGDGGLIWALLIGFLILTLLGSRGGG